MGNNNMFNSLTRGSFLTVGAILLVVFFIGGIIMKLAGMLLWSWLVTLVWPIPVALLSYFIIRKLTS